MKLPQPRMVQFQVNVRARLPKGYKITNELAAAIVERWLDGDAIPEGWDVRIVIWSDNKEREITELDDSSRGTTLRETIRGALQRRKLIIKKIRSDRT